MGGVTHTESDNAYCTRFESWEIDTDIQDGTVNLTAKWNHRPVLGQWHRTFNPGWAHYVKKGKLALSESAKFEVQEVILKMRVQELDMDENILEVRVQKTSRENIFFL